MSVLSACLSHITSYRRLALIALSCVALPAYAGLWECSTVTGEPKKVRFTVQGFDAAYQLGRQQLGVFGISCRLLGQAALDEDASKNSGPQSFPFKGLTGGDYLDAIYNGDAAEVRRLDQAYIGDVRRKFVELKRDPIFGKVFAQMDENQITLMVPAMRAYLYNYDDSYKQCLRKDSVAFTIRTTVKNGYGAQTGRTDHTYRVNKEFEEAFTATAETGQQSGIGDLGDLMYGSSVKKIEIGIEQLMTRYLCTDPQVRTFEANLLKLYGKIAAPRK